MTHDPTPLLSPAQRKLVGSAIGLAAAAAIVTLICLPLVYVARFAGFFSSVIWPLCVAGILALILRPIVAVLEKRLKIRRTAAVILLYSVFLLLGTGLLLAIVPALIAQVLDFFAYLPVLWQHTLTWGEKHFPEWLAILRRYVDNPTIKAALDGLTAQAQNLFAHLFPTLQAAGSGLFAFFRFAASLAVLPVYLFFFLLTDEDPTRGLTKHLPIPAEYRDDLVFLVHEFIGILVAFFRGQMLIGLIMGLLLATGFSLVGLRFGLVIGLIMGLLNIVPYLGSILGLSVVLPLALFQPDGSWSQVGLCLMVFAIVQAVEGWFLTPRIMGRQTGLHPVAIIVAVFFWGKALGGILGLMLAVPLTAFFVTAWRLARKKYFQHGHDTGI